MKAMDLILQRSRIEGFHLPGQHEQSDHGNNGGELPKDWNTSADPAHPGLTGKRKHTFELQNKVRSVGDEINSSFKKGKPFLFGKWQKDTSARDRYFVKSEDGTEHELYVSDTTTFDVKNRLRNPAGTRRSLRVKVTSKLASQIDPTVVVYSDAVIFDKTIRGEGLDSLNNVEATKGRISKMLNKSFGISSYALLSKPGA